MPFSTLTNKPRNNPKLKPLRAWTFRDKAQIVAAFEPNGFNYTFGTSIFNPRLKEMAAFLEEEGTKPIAGFKRITISKEDYLKLEEKYTIPLSVKEIEQVLQKFENGNHVAEFHNNNWAFGPNLTRVKKLLRDHNINASLSRVDAKTPDLNSIESHSGVIELSPQGYADLQDKKSEILEIEKKRNERYKKELQKRMDAAGIQL